MGLSLSNGAGWMNCVRRKGRDAPDEFASQLGFWVGSGKTVGTDP